MKQVHKEYEKPFVLEPTKLTRIIDTIHERLGAQTTTKTTDRFEVFLSGNRRDELDTVEEVLALENSRKLRIERLVITCATAESESSRPDHEILIDFAGPKNTFPGAARDKVTSITVRSDAVGWASRTLSELEEQIERTWLRDTLTRVALVLLAAVMLVIVMLVIVSSIIRFEEPTDSTIRAMWLRKPDLERVATLLQDNHQVTDDEFREIVTMQLNNVIGQAKPIEGARNGMTRQIALIVTPLTIVIACAIYLLAKCYPTAVFLWGDEAARYTEILSTRRIMWGIIVSLTIVGVASRLLSTEVISLIPSG